MIDLNDTICALSSAPGRSGIALIRLSGPACFDIVDRIFAPAHGGSRAVTRRAVLGRIIDPADGSELDQALVTQFQAPHSYTGEDVAEISVHGSPVVVAHLLEFLCGEGARLAEPGEFTMRAFLHGRMNLAEAEAVRDVIEANTRYQLQVANRQRSGEFSRQLEEVKERLIRVVADLETAVEFVEEDLVLETREALTARLEGIAGELGRWAASFRRGRIVREGFSLAIAGRPNVGKSSLFNALLAEERAIVTEIPGTTRDLISETVAIEGIPVRLIDTAGMREGQDPIEQIGVERSRRIMADVDAILLVVDASCPRSREDLRARHSLNAYAGIIAFNKFDLSAAWSGDEMAEFAETWPFIAVSAKTGAGVEALSRAVHEHFAGPAGQERDGLLVTNLRHYQCLVEAREGVEAAIGAVRGGLSEEFALVDLHRGLKKLGEITGEIRMDSILDQIFSRFCIGK
jgi:tRNA modification GTPase